MAVVHDLICDNDHVVRDRVVDTRLAKGQKAPYGVCKKCRTPYKICWLHGKAPGTDVLGHEVHSSVLGISYTSARERDRKMASRGFEPAGDRVRGGPAMQSGHLPKRLTPKGWEGRARFHAPEG